MNARIGRTQFWRFFARNLLALPALLIVSPLVKMAILPSHHMRAIDAGLFAATLLVIGWAPALLPSAYMAAKRLHDVGKSEQLVWSALRAAAIAPVIGAAVAFVLFIPLYLVDRDSAKSSYGTLLYYLAFAMTYLACFIPMIKVLRFCAQPGDPGENKYGDPPDKVPPLIEPRWN